MKRNALIILLALAMLLGGAIAGACGGGQGGGGQLPSGAAVTGTVEQVENDAITLNTGQDTVTVLVGEGTSIEKMGEGTIDDIVPGENISVSGEEREDGSIDASQISLTSVFALSEGLTGGAGLGLQRPGRSDDRAPPAGFEDWEPPAGFEDGPPAGAGTMGTVVPVEGNVITLEVREGTAVSVVVSDSTSIRKTVEGSLDDVSPGKNVVVWGTQTGDGPIEALSISIVDAARFGRP